MTEDNLTENNQDIPEQEELSVLDYFKARFFFREKQDAFVLPSAPIDTETDMPESVVERSDKRLKIFQVSKTGIVLIAMTLALLAQIRLETPNPDWVPSLVLYFIACGLLIWSGIKGDLQIAEPAEGGWVKDNFTAKRIPLITGLVLSLFAFFSFGGNQFTLLNVVLWLLAISYLLYAFWQPENLDQPAWYKRIWTFLRKPEWNIRITWWHILVVAVFLIGAFYRLYRLDEVPSDMISDHAEKLWDVFDLNNGAHRIFFERNTGREPLQFYLIALVMKIFSTGYTFLSLKLSTVLVGLITLPYMYKLGKEAGGNNWVALFAMLFAGVAYWTNVQARVGLRFMLYPAFVLPTLYYLIRGLRRGSRNDFILSGIALGIGLNGYSPIRVLPFVVLLAVGLFLLHNWDAAKRKQALLGMMLLVLFAAMIFLPMIRYTLENPEGVMQRSLSRLSEAERELPGEPIALFLENLVDGLAMLNLSDGVIWVVEITNRPALDIVSGAFFILGAALLLWRYIRKLHWRDLFLLLAVPALMMPSILSLAYPDENPALNRASGASVVVFLIVAIGFEAVIRTLLTKSRPRWRTLLGGGLVVFLIGLNLLQNFDLVFNKYDFQYQNAANNTAELGSVIKGFTDTVGSRDQAFVMAYPHWVDTRLVAINAGFMNKDFAVWPDQVDGTLAIPGPKMFLVKQDDVEGLAALEAAYPKGASSLYTAKIEHKSFFVFFVPAEE